MAANPGNPILFWSRRCRFSAEVFEVMQLLGKTNLFKTVCIEEVRRDALPPQLTDVPSVWDPATQRVFCGKGQVMEFMSKAGMNTRRDTPTGVAQMNDNINIDALDGLDGPDVGGLLNEPSMPLVPIGPSAGMMTDKDPDALARKLEEMKAEMQGLGMQMR